MSPRTTQRWAALLAAVAVAAALLVSGGAAWLQARAASERTIESSAAELRAALSAELRGGSPTNEALAEALSNLSDLGMRAIVWSHDGSRVSAGEPDEVAALFPLLGDSQRPVMEHGDRVRATSRQRGGRNGRVRRWRGRGPPRADLAFSFEPIEAKAQRTNAALTLGIGSGSAILLMVFAVVLGRSWVAGDRSEKEREAQEHLAMLGTMTAVLGHEIKNPLASLKGNAQLLARKLTDPDLVRKAERVVSEAERLEALAGRILAFARDEVLDRQPTDLGALFAGLLDRLDEADVSVTVPPSTEVVSIDAQWVEQAVENLVRNARDAAGEGAVLLRARLAGDFLVIEVQDSGPGIPAGLRDQVLQPFHTTKIQGTGLGLAVVNRVANKHGGSVEIEDAPGGGAVVRMNLRRS